MQTEVLLAVPLSAVSHNKSELLLKCIFYLTLRKYVGPDLEQHLWDDDPIS